MPQSEHWRRKTLSARLPSRARWRGCKNRDSGSVGQSRLVAQRFIYSSKCRASQSSPDQRKPGASGTTNERQFLNGGFRLDVPTTPNIKHCRFRCPVGPDRRSWDSVVRAFCLPRFKGGQPVPTRFDNSLLLARSVSVYRWASPSRQHAVLDLCLFSRWCLESTHSSLT